MKVTETISITIITIIGILALATAYLWGFGAGFREGYIQADISMEKALKSGYEIGLDKGIHALEVRDRK